MGTEHLNTSNVNISNINFPVKREENKYSFYLQFIKYTKLNDQNN